MPHLSLGAVRRALAPLGPVRSGASAGGDSQRLLLTLAGATLLVLAAAGSVTLTRTSARARA
jgi:hypothetical protein